MVQKIERIVQRHCTYLCELDGQPLYVKPLNRFHKSKVRAKCYEDVYARSTGLVKYIKKGFRATTKMAVLINRAAPVLRTVSKILSSKLSLRQ